MLPADKSTHVLLAGATGLIGHAIKKQLHALNIATTTIGRNDCDLSLDFSSPSDIDLSARSYTHFIHAAGVTDEEVTSTPEQALIRASINLETLLRQLPDTCHTLVYISSAHVYGELKGSINETTRPNPLNLYAQCHYLSEQGFVALSRRSNKAIFILRPCAVYGELRSLDDFNRWSLIPFAFPKAATQTRHIVLKSNGKQIRNFVSSHHIARTIASIIEQPTSLKINYINPIGKDNLSVREFALLVANIYQHEYEKDCEVTTISSFDRTEEKPLEFTSDVTQQGSDSELSEFITSLLKRLELYEKH